MRRVVVQLARPDDAATRARAAACRDQPLSLPAGSTAGPCPAGFATNTARVRIGEGERTFALAAAAVFALRMFDTGWTRAVGTDAVRVGTDIATPGKLLGCWWTNVCRVTKVIDEPRRRGFVYTTLRPHLLAGEERFAVERDRDDAVWFEVFAYARPAHWLTRLGWPILRAVQRRFAVDAPAAIARAVAAAGDAGWRA